MTSASVIILNWNGGIGDCSEAVDSALAQDHPDLEVIFVDNGSDDGSFEAVRASYPDLTFVQTGSNLGCPEGRNRGAEKATGDIIFFLENDGVWDSKQLVSDVVRFMDSNPSVGALYTGVEGYETGVVDPPLDNAASLGEPGLASAFRGGAAAVRRGLFESTGGFPGVFFRQAEERYVALRVYDLGFDVAYWPLGSMRHKGSDYPGKSSQVAVYSLRNTLLTVDWLYPHPLVWIHLLLYLSINLLRFARANELGLFLRAVREYRAMRGDTPGHRRIRLSTLWKVTRVQRGGPRTI